MRAGLVIACGALGAGLKAAALFAGGLDAAQADESDALRRLKSSLSASGFQVEEVEAVAPVGPYAALVLASPTCDGALRLMPLHRNGEAAILVMAAGEQGVADVTAGYIVDGRIFQSYPVLRHQYALARRKLLGKRASGPLVAAAFWEVGECDLAQFAIRALRPGETSGEMRARARKIEEKCKQEKIIYRSTIFSLI